MNWMAGKGLWRKVAVKLLPKGEWHPVESEKEESGFWHKEGCE